MKPGLKLCATKSDKGHMSRVVLAFFVPIFLTGCFFSSSLRNLNGSSGGGPSQEVDPFPPDVLNLIVSAAETDLTLTWSSGGGSSKSYRISYQLGAAAPADCFSGNQVESSQILGTSHTITGLSQGTTYSLRVCALNGNLRPDASPGVTVTVTTKILATALRAIFTSEQPNKSFTFRSDWVGPTDQVFGVSGSNFVVVDVGQRTREILTRPSGVNDSTYLSFKFSIVIGASTFLIYYGDDSSGNRVIIALNVSTKIALTIASPTDVPFITNFQGFVYFGFTNASNFEVYRSDITSTEQALNLAFSYSPPKFLGKNSNYLFLTYSPTGYNDVEVYRLTAGAPGVFSAVTNFCPTASCSGFAELSSVPESILMGEIIYFPCATSATNRSLCKTDGTVGGTVHIKTLGTTNNHTANRFVRVNSTHFMFQLGYTGGIQGSDGTLAGTVQLSATMEANDIHSVNNGSYLFWIANNQASGQYQLWKTDGTLANSQLLATEVDYYSRSLALVNDDLFYFSASGGLGYELYKYSVTADSETLLKDITPGTSSFYSDYYRPGLSIINGTSLVFLGFNNYQYELWKTDGSPVGTELLKDINQYPLGSSIPRNFVALNSGKLLFSAVSSEHGEELWVTDGTAAGTEMIADFEVDKIETDGWTRSVYEGDNSYFSYTLKPKIALFSNGKTPVIYQHPFWGESLYGLDTVNDNFSLIHEVFPGIHGSETGISSSMSFVGKNLFFPASEYPSVAASGPNTQQWVSDGTTLGTKNILGTALDWFFNVISPLTLINSNQVIITNWINVSDAEFHNYNIDTGVATTVSNVCPGICAQTGWNANQIGKVSDTKFVFRDGSGTNFVSDGTLAGTNQFAPSLLEAQFTGGVVLNNKFLFLGGIDGLGWGIYTTDGTTGGTLPVFIFDSSWNFASHSGDYGGAFHLMGDFAYVIHSSEVMEPTEIHVTDGTAGGTKLIKSLLLGSESLVSFYAIDGDVNSRAVAFIEDSSSDKFLYIVDPVAAAATRFSDSIIPSTGYSVLPVRVGDRMIYGFDNGKLYSMNLETNESVLLMDSTSSARVRLCSKNGRLYFTGHDVNHGSEIWYTDGTVEGTRIWRDLNPGYLSSWFGTSIEVSNKCYFWGKFNSSDNPKIFVLDF